MTIVTLEQWQVFRMAAKQMPFARATPEREVQNSLPMRVWCLR